VFDSFRRVKTGSLLTEDFCPRTNLVSNIYCTTSEFWQSV